MAFDIDIKSIQEIFDAEKELYSNYFTIKVKTCYYHSNRGIHSRKDITVLVKKSNPNMACYFFEDVSIMGVEYKHPYKKFFDLEDGEYRVKIQTSGRSSYYDDYFECEYVIEKV